MNACLKMAGALWVGLSVAIGCSSGSPGGGGGTGGGGGGGSGGGCCTVNAKTYQCPDSTSLGKCNGANPDPSGCSSDPSCSSNNTTSSRFCCGYNGSYYDCPTSDALADCSRGSSGACTARASKCSQ